MYPPVDDPARHNRNPAYVRGFTLIELVITLVILSILSYTVISRWSASTFDLQAAAEQLVADIRYTQMLAMTRGQRYRINFTASSYWISDRTNSATIPEPATNQATMALPGGISLSPSGILVFDGNGIPYSDAALPGTTAGDTTLSLGDGSETRQILINAETGRVTLQ
jgi:prepilin-type N-terminal cleavage/methylation domain-containing protein